MKIERIKLVELRHDDQNARTHDQANLKAIAGSLEQFGQRKPIVITQDNKVVAGNGTLIAAKLVGWTEIDCVRVPADWTADQIKAYALADNRTAELAQWDEQVMAAQLLDLQEAGFDIEAIGFELIEPAIDPATIEEDEIPKDAPTRTALGDIWKIGNHFLLCGDSTNQENWKKILNDEIPNLVFTDPPYGIGYQAMRGGKKIANDSNENEALDVTKNALKNFVDVKAHFVCCDWRSMSTMLSAMSDVGIIPKACIVWDKMRRVQNLDRFAKQHEFILYAGPYGGEKTVATDVWQIARDFNPDHPTPKPIELVAKAITYTTNVNDVVVDAFAGSGSTLIACEKTDRRARVIELDPKYCDVIIQRWENLTGKKAELVNASR
jgi:DNA modification methylase